MRGETPGGKVIRKRARDEKRVETRELTGHSVPSDCAVTGPQAPMAAGLLHLEVCKVRIVRGR